MITRIAAADKEPAFWETVRDFMLGVPLQILSIIVVAVIRAAIVPKVQPTVHSRQFTHFEPSQSITPSASSLASAAAGQFETHFGSPHWRHMASSNVSPSATIWMRELMMSALPALAVAQAVMQALQPSQCSGLKAIVL